MTLSRQQTRELRPKGRPVWCIALALALAVALMGCGGGDTPQSADSGTPSAVEGNTEQAPSNDEKANTDGDSNGPKTLGEGFDVSALPTAPISAALLTMGASESANGDLPEPLVEACSVLDSPTVDTIVSSYDALGLTFDFSEIVNEGASCLYRSDTHALRVTVHGADVLNEAFIESQNFLGGDVTSEPALSDPSATIYFEDSFGAVTPFAARAEREGLAVVVTNSGGTGILSVPDEQDGLADIALAALDNVIAEGVTPVPLDASPEAPSKPDPCAVYTEGELSKAFGTPLGLVPVNETTLPSCVWENGDRTVTVTIQSGIAGEDQSYFQAETPLGDGIYSQGFGSEAVVATPEVLFQVRVVVQGELYGLEVSEFGGVEQRETQPIVDVLVANLLERLA